MALSPTQEGQIGQFEAGKYAVVTSGGLVEIAWPWTDDDHRDMEAHLRHLFYPPAALQVKTTWRLWVHRASEVIQILFRLPPERVLNDPAFWYLFGFMDAKLVTFRDPLFLVNSKDVHERAEPRLVDGIWHFTFEASLKPGTHDKWSPNQVPAAKLGDAVVGIIRDLHRDEKAALVQGGRRLALPVEQSRNQGVLWLCHRELQQVRRNAA